MAEGKWIPGLTAATPLALAVRQALVLRLEAVNDHLQPAAELAHEDIEHVHQLRVATRRCRAVIDLFADVLGHRLHNRLRRPLRRIRRSAGPARDWDVFGMALLPRLANATPRTRPGLNWIAGQVAARRALAQEELVATYPELAKDLRHWAGHAGHVQEDNGSNGALTTLGQVARARLPLLVEALANAGSGDLKNAEHLHRLRIEGKRLRYAMEVFADCFPSAFREVLYPQIEELQEHLGNINDAHVALTLLSSMQSHTKTFYQQHWRQWQPGVSALKNSYRQRLKRAQQRFEPFWKTLQLDDLYVLVRAPNSERTIEAP